MTKEEMQRFLYELNSEYDYDLSGELNELPKTTSPKEQLAQKMYLNLDKIISMINKDNIKLARLFWSFCKDYDDYQDEDLKHPDIDHSFNHLLYDDIQNRKKAGRSYSKQSYTNKHKAIYNEARQPGKVVTVEFVEKIKSEWNTNLQEQEPLGKIVFYNKMAETFKCSERTIRKTFSIAFPKNKLPQKPEN